MAVQVEPEHVGGMIVRTPGCHWSGALEAQGIEIEGIDVEVDDANKMVVGNQLIEGRRSSCSRDSPVI